ncbi:MAG: ATP-binding protein [Deferrisomatales bacterium]|nr:ATP-binding protein [Deferrisomatales bacterium]
MPGGEARRDVYVKVAAVVVAILAVSFLHYATQTGKPVLHDLYRRLYYVPVGLGAVWFGLRGGVLAAAAVGLAYGPHILLHWQHESREVINQSMEVVFYFAFSGVIGYFADQERRLRVRCQSAALRLDRSYKQLRRQADLILEIEEQLRAADRLAAMGQLAAGVTHEIRNPLGSIRGTAEILREEFPPGHPKAEFLDILVRETERLNRVVEDFLGYARQGQQAETEACDLGKVVHQTAALTEAQARKAGVEVRCEVPEGLTVRGSPGQLTQVVLNLVLNAVQASPPGGEVRVTAEVRPGRVPGREYREVEGKLVFLQVEDRGPGLPADVLSHAFQPFFTTKEEGTGLGLAISKRIAEAHGGRIAAENRPERGARFTLILPLAPDS